MVAEHVRGVLNEGAGKEVTARRVPDDLVVDREIFVELIQRGALANGKDAEDVGVNADNDDEEGERGRHEIAGRPGSNGHEGSVYVVILTRGRSSTREWPSRPGTLARRKA